MCIRDRGGNDEQHSQSGGGADPERADLPLSTANEEEVTAKMCIRDSLHTSPPNYYQNYPKEKIGNRYRLLFSVSKETHKQKVGGNV